MGLRGSGRDAVNRSVGGMPHAQTARQAVGGGRAKVGACAVSQHLKPPLRYTFLVFATRNHANMIALARHRAGPYTLCRAA